MCSEVILPGRELLPAIVWMYELEGMFPFAMPMGKTESVMVSLEESEKI